MIKKIILIVAMSYQNPDYELKLTEAKARKILSHLKLKSAGRSRKEKAAAEGLVGKRKSEIDKKVAEVEAKKSEEIAKKQRTKTKVHPKPEPPKAPEPPKSLVIGDTMANIKAPAPYQEYGGRGRGRGRGGRGGGPGRVRTQEEIIAAEQRRLKENEKYAKEQAEMDEKLKDFTMAKALEYQKNYDEQQKEFSRLKKLSAEERSFEKYKARIAAGQEGFSDSDDD